MHYKKDAESGAETDDSGWDEGDNYKEQQSRGPRGDEDGTSICKDHAGTMMIDCEDHEGTGSGRREQQQYCEGEMEI